MSNRSNTSTARLVYNNALDMLKDAGIDADSAMCTQSDLILEQQMTTAANSYLFPVLNLQPGSNGAAFNTEIRLTQQDAFVVASWGMFLAAPSSATDATFIVHTYPNPVTFTGGAAAAAETLYNSTITVKVNNDVVYPVLSTSRFRMVPQSQAVAGDAGVYPGIAYDEIDLGEDGFFAVEPNLVIIGSKGTVIQLNLPQAMAAVTSFQRTRMHMRGLLAQNVTIIT
jgi:hypothetical protein